MSSAQEIIDYHAKVGTTPEGALKCWFDAIFLYIDIKTRDEGRKALQNLTIPFKPDTDWDKKPSNGTFKGVLQGKTTYIFNSYAKGTSPENQYSMDKSNYELNVEKSHEDKYGKRGWAVFLRSSGADSSRPVYLKKSSKTGLYYPDTISNVYLGIRKPVDPDVETFE
eukprot:gene1997-1504_t